MQDDVRNAMLTLLSTLPVEAEIRFYWQDGSQHMSLRMPGEQEQVARLSRAPSGAGVVVPVTLQ